MKHLFTAIVFSFFLQVFSWSQTISIQKTNELYQIDGKPNEPFWQQAYVFKNFTQNFPTDSLPAQNTTEVKMALSENGILVYAKCFHDKNEKGFSQSLRRDFDFYDQDCFGFYFDPFLDGLNGFMFLVSEKGAQSEALIGNGADVIQVWDNKWESNINHEVDYWEIEILIPFKSIRFPIEKKQWRVNFIRNSLNQNERSCFVQIPINFEPPVLAFAQTIEFNEKLPNVKNNFSIIPSLTYEVNKDYLNQQPTKQFVTPSLDAKIAVTPSLNLDITINPDFSQAEVDVQQTNLTRFELFFPERRQFFIENSDLFETFGFRQIRPFFSRRIGLYNGNKVPIIAGARLSGKLNKNWRVGLMNIQTEGNGNLGINPQNYSVAAVQRKIFNRSNIAFIAVNRQGFSGNEINSTDYNRVAGIDYNIASKDNKWRGKIFHHQAFTPNQPKNSFANASWVMYNNRNWFLMWNHEYVGKNYNPETGFSPRNRMFDPTINSYRNISYYRLEPMLRYSFFPKNNSSIVNRHGPELYWDYYTDVNLNPTDNLLRFSYLVTFNNTSTLNARYSNIFTKLFFPTDVTFTNNTLIPQGIYHYNNYGLNYSSDFRKNFQTTLSLFQGDYFTGKRSSYAGSVIYRYKPFGNISVSYERNAINLPENNNVVILNLFGLQTDISFSTSVFFKTFIQYNTQLNNLNLNSRLQWRFKPMSDLYLVYSENYDPYLKIKNRALIIKFIYWITV